MVKNVKSLPGGSTGGDITMVSVGLSRLPCSPWDRIIIQTPTACVTTEETGLFTTLSLYRHPQHHYIYIDTHRLFHIERNLDFFTTLSYPQHPQHHYTDTNRLFTTEETWTFHNLILLSIHEILI